MLTAKFEFIYAFFLEPSLCIASIIRGTPREVFSQTEILRKAGLDVPQTTLLLQELADEGYELPRDALTPEEGAEALAKILGERGKAE